MADTSDQEDSSYQETMLLEEKSEEQYAAQLEKILKDSDEDEQSFDLETEKHTSDQEDSSYQETTLLEEKSEEEFAAKLEKILQDSDSDEQSFDLETEKDCIIGRMLGWSFKEDGEFQKHLTFCVDVYKSFRTGIPRHCKLKCLSDPTFVNYDGSENCCWNQKRTECQGNMKNSFRKEITALTSQYLITEGKSAIRFPEYCDSYLKDWYLKHSGNPYASEEEAHKMAQFVGLTVDQIRNLLQKERSKKKKGVTPDGAVQAETSQRKGGRANYPGKDILKLKYGL